MPNDTVESFMQRARDALDMPTFYWLGEGGWQGAQAPDPPQREPGTSFNPAQGLAAFQQADPAKYAKFKVRADEEGIAIAELPQRACDCTGFVSWALGVARHPAPIAGDWIYTNAIHADALGPHRLFVVVESARIGDMLVYPGEKNDPQAKAKIGHIGIVSQLDGQGQPLLMIHCGNENYFVKPGPGRARNSIAQTDKRCFDDNDKTLLVRWRAFDD